METPSEKWWKWLWDQPRHAFDTYFEGYTSKEEILELFEFRRWDMPDYMTAIGPELWEWRLKDPRRGVPCWVTGEQVTKWFH